MNEKKAKPEFKLDVSPVGDTQIKLRRQFRASRDMVFKCFTDASLLSQWLGCMGAVVQCEVDMSIGGSWRFVMNMKEHGRFETFGQILAFEPSRRLVRSYVYNTPETVEKITTETATFNESSGLTTVEILIRHLDKSSRDGHLEAGLEFGAGTSFDSLEQLLQEKTLQQSEYDSTISTRQKIP
jgi:uncharacterized protein YndB with AHSA1/START domain